MCDLKEWQAKTNQAPVRLRADFSGGAWQEQMAEVHGNFPITYLYCAVHILVYIAHSKLRCSRAMTYVPKTLCGCICEVRNICTHASCLGQDFLQALEVAGALAQVG